jgi:hypothetical protein
MKGADNQEKHPANGGELLKVISKVVHPLGVVGLSECRERHETMDRAVRLSPKEPASNFS